MNLAKHEIFKLAACELYDCRCVSCYELLCLLLSGTILSAKSRSPTLHQIHPLTSGQVHLLLQAALRQVVITCNQSRPVHIALAFASRTLSLPYVTCRRQANFFL